MRKFPGCSVLFLSLALTIQSSPALSPGDQKPNAPAPSLDAASALIQHQSPAMMSDPGFGRLPVDFIANQGQMDERVAFYVQGKDKTIYFTPDGVTMALGSGPDPWVVKLDFVGANADVKPLGLEKTDAVVSYFKGKPEEWRAGLPTYSKIAYPGLWPGIDLLYYGTVNRLKYEFVVHPGADPSRIRLAYRGVERVSVTANGRLEVTTPSERFCDDIPFAYQELEGHRVEVPLNYKFDDPLFGAVEGCRGQAGSDALIYSYGFDVGEYDPTLPLVLDPAIIIYCGYIGGSSTDYGYQIAVDGSGNAYLVGHTSSGEASFPVTVGPQLIFGGSSDAFVAKVNPSGTALVYCGYIGGNDSDIGQGIAVDGDGNAYVTGYTLSSQPSFPVVTGPDLSFNGVDDCFVAKVNPSGTALVYCGYIGGDSYDEGYDIAVDGAGNAYVCGVTDSAQPNFPVLAGPDITHNGLYDAFVAKVNAAGSSLAYCGYIGGSSQDWGYGVAVDGPGNAYVTGYSSSSEATFPCIEGPDLSYNGGLDVFVAKVGVSGTLAYCGYIGGSSDESGYDVAVDGSGSAYVAGYAKSTESTFPVLSGPDLTYNGGQWDGFVAKVNPSGSALAYCGYIGGSAIDYIEAIAVNSSGSAFVVGGTGSTEATFPVSGGPDLSYNGGYNDAFIAKINPSGMALDYCGYIGGSMMDIGKGIALDEAGNAFVAGQTDSTEASFPVTVGPFLTHSGGEYEADAFVAKLTEIPIWHPRHAVGDFDGDGSDEAAVDFGATGIYMYDGGAWTQLSAANPESLMAADVDGDNVDELLADLGASGLWLWNAGAWNQISGVNVEGMAAGDIDADGAEEVIGDFGTVGMWLYNGGAWSQLSGVNADYIDCANLDGSGGEEIVGDFGSTGLWIWNTGAWTQLSGVNADYMAFGNTDGSGGEELIGDFGPTGLWLYSSGSGWLQLSGVNADYLATVQANGDAPVEFVGDFGATGLWLWNGGLWDQLSGVDADFMIAADTDGNGTDEGGVDFGALGLWLGDFVTGWTQVSGVNPEYLMAGDFDGDNADEILADFGSLGLWLWNGGAWSQVSALNPE